MKGIRVRWLLTALGHTALAMAQPTPPPPAPYLRPAAPAARFAGEVASVEVREAEEVVPRLVVSERPDADAPATVQEDQLLPVLRQRLSASVGKGAPPLKFVVTVLEVDGRRLYDSTATVRLRTQVSSAERELAAIEGTSTLTGRLGGQSAGTSELLLAAILDAFERSVLVDSFVERVNGALVAETRAEGAILDGRGPHNSWEVAEHEYTATAHVAGASLDVGRSYSYGLRYLYEYVSGGGAPAWWGPGIEARLLSHKGDELDAAAGLAVFRAGIAPGQGFSVELAVGAARSDRMVGMGLTGLYWGLHYGEIGFSYQFPFAPTRREDWMSGALFGIRIHIPVAASRLEVHRRSPLPFTEQHVLPGFRPDGFEFDARTE